MPIKISKHRMPLAGNGTINGEGRRTVTWRLGPCRHYRAISWFTSAELLGNGCDCLRPVVAALRSELLT
jgi:hypothetical protein